MQDNLLDAERDLVAAGDMEPLQGNESHETLRINKLNKKYGDKTVVNDLTLSLFNDQILVLLGHNGAGKTTTINLLTDQTKANGGVCMLGEHDLLTNFETIVDSVGVCPQENVLITKMSVVQNL